jgi:putative acetyltransferase
VVIRPEAERTSGERSIVMLSPLAVDPNHHGRGIGSELVRRATALGIEIPLPHWAPIEAGQVLRLRSYLPALRGRVVYPASFDVLGDEVPGPSNSR